MMDNMLRAALQTVAKELEREYAHNLRCPDPFCQRTCEYREKAELGVLNALAEYGDGRTGFWESWGVMTDYYHKHKERVKAYPIGECG